MTAAEVGLLFSDFPAAIIVSALVHSRMAPFFLPNNVNAISVG